MSSPENTSRLIEQLSPRLFWDTEAAIVDPINHGKWLVERVLTRGKWADWNRIRQFYGDAALREIVVRIRCLPPKAEAFCCTVLGLKRESMRCYIERQSNPAYLTWHNG